MSAQIIKFKAARSGGGKRELPLTYQVDGAIAVLRRAQELLAEQPGFDRRMSGPRFLKAHLGIALSTLEKGMAAYKEQAQRELSEVILEALGSGVTVAEVSGAKNMLALLHDALPDYPDRV
jgi:hypothetical protein